ncbi:MAG: hypothetical protein R3F59_06135 [Myxococcota bacterium]
MHRWFCEPLPDADDEEGEDDGDDALGEHDAVCRVRVTDRAGAVVAQQRLPFEPELHVSPSGALATFQGAQDLRHLARLAGRRDDVGVVIVDAHLDEVVHLHPEGRVEEISEAGWASDEVVLFEVRTDEDERLEAWAGGRGERLWALEEVWSWAVVGPDRVVVCADAGGALLDAATGERLVELGEIDEAWPLPDGRFATAAGDALTVHEADGTAVREASRPPGARPDGDGFVDDGGRRWDADGVLRTDHASAVVAAAFDGRRLASLDEDSELIVRELPSGRVLVRGRLPGGIDDWTWREDGRRALAWLGDRLVLCLGEALRVLDVGSGAFSAAAPSALVDIAVDGATLVSAHRDGAVRRWAADGTLLQTLPGPAAARRSPWTASGCSSPPTTPWCCSAARGSTWRRRRATSPCAAIASPSSLGAPTCTTGPARGSPSSATTAPTPSPSPRTARCGSPAASGSWSSILRPARSGASTARTARRAPSRWAAGRWSARARAASSSGEGYPA